MEPKKNNSAVIAALVAIIVLLCGALIYFVFIKDKEEAKPKEEEQQEKTTVKINYEIKESTTSSTNSLYVNNKLVGKDYYNVEKEDVYDLGDLLLVGECRSTCQWFFVDADGNIAGTLGYYGEELASAKELVRPMAGSVGYIKEVKDKTIYFVDYKYNTQDGSSICNYDDEEAVYYEEKVTYEGNGKFGEPQVETSKTKTQVMKEDAKFVCE